MILRLTINNRPHKHPFFAEDAVQLNPSNSGLRKLVYPVFDTEWLHFSHYFGKPYLIYRSFIWGADCSATEGKNQFALRAELVLSRGYLSRDVCRGRIPNVHK